METTRLLYFCRKPTLLVWSRVRSPADPIFRSCSDHDWTNQSLLTGKEEGFSCKSHMTLVETVVPLLSACTDSDGQRAGLLKVKWVDTETTMQFQQCTFTAKETKLRSMHTLFTSEQLFPVYCFCNSWILCVAPPLFPERTLIGLACPSSGCASKIEVSDRFRSWNLSYLVNFPPGLMWNMSNK